MAKSSLELKKLIKLESDFFLNFMRNEVKSKNKVNIPKRVSNIFILFEIYVTTTILPSFLWIIGLIFFI